MRSNRYGLSLFAPFTFATLAACSALFGASACGSSSDDSSSSGITDDGDAGEDAPASTENDASKATDGAARSEDAAKPPADARDDAEVDAQDAARDGGFEGGDDAAVGLPDAADGAAEGDASDAEALDATVAPDASDAGTASDATLAQDAGGEDAGSDEDATDSAAPAVVNFVSGVTVSTLAGSAYAGEQDGVGDAALFDNPTGIAIDHAGNLIVVDYDGWTVRVVTPAGAVRTIGRADSFVHPFAAAVADDGAYFVSTDDDPQDGGDKTGTSGAVWSVTSYDGGVAAPVPIAASLSRPRGLTAADDGGLFVVARYLGIVEHLDTSTGALQLIAGGGDAGYAEGTGAQAFFNSPIGTARLPSGSYAVADTGNGRIRLVTPSGVVSTLAGDGTVGMIDGPCATARFNVPHAVAADAAGNLYVSDGGNQRIRRIRTTGGCVVETLAGNGATDFADGPGDQAAFFGAEGIDVTADGRTVYVADGDMGSGTSYHRIRAITIP